MSDALDAEAGEVRFAQAGDVRLAYRTWGLVSAPPLVLLHALGEESSDWAPIAVILARSWRVYALDVRGHGASDWSGPYTIEGLTADLAAFLEEPPPPWPRARRVVSRPEGPLRFDWHATALSNEFTDPQVTSWRDSLSRIEAPTLIVAGGSASHVDQDYLASMAGLIPGCDLVSIPAGHLVHGARPADFTATVAAFLGG